MKSYSRGGGGKLDLACPIACLFALVKRSSLDFGHVLDEVDDNIRTRIVGVKFERVLLDLKVDSY